MTKMIAVAALTMLSLPALADHQVVAHGSVLFTNLSNGPLVGVPASTPVELRFVVQHVPTVVVPNQISEYAFNFAETRLVVGTHTLLINPGPTPPVMLFENDNELDSVTDGVETTPDVVDLAGTPYQMRFHAHDITANIFSSADISQNAGTYPVSQIHHLTWTVYSGIEGMLIQLDHFDVIPGTPVPGCDSIDFNGDTLFPDTQDIADFLTVFGGGACPTASCNDIDFNNDDLFPDTDDISALLRVFAGGACAG